MNRFDGKVALVTGAGQGIGEATARRLAAEGARVAVTDISGRQEQVAASIGAQALALHCDVTSSKSLADTIAKIVDSFGALHVAVNNVGLPARFAHVADLSEEEFDRVFEVDLKSVFVGMKYQLPAIVSSGGGAIVNISSAAGASGFHGLSAYSAMKGGIMSITRAAAAEYACLNVRVNCVLPGMTRTPGALAHYERITDDPNAAMDQQGGESMMGRVGEPAELAAAIAFLASEDASYITGLMLPVDGGMLASPGLAYRGG
jgi:NAD(P)-dependent dehydrogenase (short-subunit alcohol dehydrogenase family)